MITRNNRIQIHTYTQALEYLYRHIPRGDDFMFPGNFGLLRTKYLLNLLDNPQNKIRVIHVAGTSGKGSTSYFISIILRSLGFKVGLSLSPHLLDLRERFQVNNKLISEANFCKYLSEVACVVDKMVASEFGLPTFFEIVVAFSYYLYAEMNLDYAVMETGLGGLYDATNVVDRSDKVSIITKIGHDHTKILGATLKEISFQKAGIIQSGNTVITIDQNKRVLDVIRRESSIKRAKLYVVNNNQTNSIALLPQPKFNFNFLEIFIQEISLKMIGSFQIQNCSLALATIIFLSKRDVFSLNISKIKQSLARSNFRGRMEVKRISGKEVVIDGAHNPQKMSEFINNLLVYYPKQKFDFLIAFKKGKDYKKILRFIVPYARKIIVTSFFNQTKFQGMRILAEDTKVIGNILNILGFNNFVMYYDNKAAISEMLSTNSGVKVITGSLYLLSDVFPLLDR